MSRPVVNKFIIYFLKNLKEYKNKKIIPIENIPILPFVLKNSALSPKISDIPYIMITDFF